MNMTVLLENTTADARLEAEHGLSLYLEVNGRRVLFDMGQSDRFAKNAQALGVSLSAVDTAVLSHGHYDHGGGLPTFLACNDHAPIYVNLHAFEPHYNGTDKYIGLDTTLRSHKRLRFTDEVTSLGDGMTLFSCNDRTPTVETSHYGLTHREGDRFHPDRFLHEQCLLIEEHGKRILVSGCSHKGALNWMAWFRPDVFIGGFHFVKLTEGEPLTSYAAALAAYDCAYYTGHCTGDTAMAYLQGRLPRLTALSTGLTFAI